MRSAEDWIASLGMLAHPEGGFYAETYRSDESVGAAGLPDRYGSSRNLGTSIYFMLRAGDISRLHRLASDELWHFHTGDALELVLLSPEGKWSVQKLGLDVDAGESLQLIVPRNHWFGARVLGEAYTLMGCTVAPGFEFVDFELADRNALLNAYPQHREQILLFT